MLGQRFGSLVVLERTGAVGDKRGVFWLCQCDCGARYIAPGFRLRAGRVRRCQVCWAASQAVKDVQEEREAT